MSRHLLTIFFALLLTPALLIRPADAAEETKSQASNPVVAVFTLEGPMTEAPPDEMLALFGEPGVALRDFVKRFNQAADDDNVKAIVMLSEGGQLGLAQVEELRQAMQRARSKGKDVYAHSGSMGLGEYVLFSGANRISLVPTSDVWISGIYAEQPFVRGLLDKIGVQPDFMSCGAYKSAAEMFTRTEPSAEADANINWLLDGIYTSLIKQIAAGRDVDEAKVRSWIDGGPYNAEVARERGLVDAIEHRQEFEAMLKSKYGQNITFEKKYAKKKSQDLDLSSPMAFFKIWGELLGGGAQKQKSTKPAIAIVYVEGPIVEGKSDSNPFAGSMAASTPIRKALDEAARDDSIKAVVLRVDSPGGSATASEIILDATKRVKARKPLVVSMGNVAGSGGYYVACGSDMIFADENTITGSIGVVFGKLVTNPMWDKVGITFKEYKRGENAGILSSAAAFTPQQREHMQSWMNNIYEVFKSHVTEIRGDRLKKPLEELAGGRVYTGQQALELGLIDKIGTLSDALEHVAKEANVTDYDVRVVPEPKNLIEKLLEGNKDNPEDRKWIAAGSLKTGSSIMDLALPFLQQVDPQRAKIIARALQQLQTLHDEGCVLMMPELIFTR